MSELKQFQQATVKAVIKAFRKRGGSRRFLIADEVGLGKTVVAQHVIKELMEGRRKPLVVFYLCSSLAIARQNRRKLLEVLPMEERERADCPVDRLSLMKVAEQPTSPQLHLYSFTPDTSIPIRKRHRRDGRQEERALIHVLVRRIWPEFFRIYKTTVFRRGIKSAAAWREAKRKQRPHVSKAKFRQAFIRSVREEFGLQERQKLLPVLQRLKDQENLKDIELIAHFRNALAASAIEEVAPDLVIFDEFQRFRDLLEKQKNASARRVIDRLTGDHIENPPALLLLSATPYRLYSTSAEEGADSRFVGIRWQVPA